MTAQDIIDEIKTILPINSSNTDFDTVMLSILNRSYHGVERMRQWQWLEEKSVINTTGETREYIVVGSKDHDVKPGSIRNVRIEDEGIYLPAIDRENYIRSNPRMDSSRPNFFRAYRGDVDHDNKMVIEFYPPTDGHYKIDLDYTKLLADLATTDELQMPTIFHETVLNRTTALVAAREGNKEIFQIFQNLFNEQIAQQIEEDITPMDMTVEPGVNSVRPIRQPFMPDGHGVLLDE